MRPIILILLWIFCIFQSFGQESMVFEAEKEGHTIYRIPAIISLPNSELLAIAEGRVHGSNDYGDINLVMKKSGDKGKTWSPLKLLVDHGVYQAGNPAPVVDRFDPKYPEGVIYVFFNTGNHHEYNIRLNEGVREVWYTRSTDMGESWEDFYFEPQLPDPVCQGSILDIGESEGKKILAHSNASDPQRRDNLTIKISWDEGKTWTNSILVDKSDDPSKPSWTAYSDLVKLDEDHLGILYERNDYKEIIFKKIKWKE